jgi:DNA-binding beta-propeller fold protein YncE
MFVLGDGTRLFSSGHTILLLTPSGRLATIAGNPLEEEVALKDGQGIFARFNGPEGLTVDRAGNVVVADWGNHAIRSVAKEGAVVSTLAGGRQEDDEENDGVEEGFADGHGASARFNQPQGVVVAANGDIFVADTGNHAIRVITPQGAVHALRQRAGRFCGRAGDGRALRMAMRSRAGRGGEPAGGRLWQQRD